VVRSKINGLDLHQSLSIDAIGTVIRRILLPGLIEKSFIANTDEVPWVQRFDIRADFFCPIDDQGWSTVRPSREVPGTVSSTTRLVGEFPSEYRWRAHIPRHHSFDVFLEGGFDFRKPEELRSSGSSEYHWKWDRKYWAYVVVVLTPEVDGVQVHPKHVLLRFGRDLMKMKDKTPSVIGPVVRQGEQKLDSLFLSEFNELVEPLETVFPFV